MVANSRRQAARGGASGDLRALQERMAELEAQLAAQWEEIARLRAERGERTGAPAPPLPPASSHRRPCAPAADEGTAPRRASGRHTSRRGLLRLSGAAAAAGVAAGALDLWRPASARAAPVLSGLPLILGQANDANATTSLTATAASTPSPILNVTQPNTGIGVHGSVNAFGNVAIEGDATGGGVGVIGSSDTFYGVIAVSSLANGLEAQGGRFGATLIGGAAQLFLEPMASAGAPTSGIHVLGEVFLDSAGSMFICVGNGTPGTWRRVAALAPGYAGGSLNLLPVPIRLLDTRAGAPVGNDRPGTPVAYHGTINVPAAGVTYAGQTIPAGAVAVYGLLTAALAPGINCGDGSSAIAYATGATRPAAVSVIFNPQDLHGAYTANFAMVRTGSGGDISIYNQPINAVAVDYLFDCFGFVM